MSNKSSLFGKYYGHNKVEERAMRYDDMILHRKAKELKREHKRERQARRKARK